MAKRLTFEDITGKEFSWPIAGDEAFIGHENGLNDALIADDLHSRLVLMTDGYKKASDLMVDATELDRSTRDFLVFPIVFNYRHFLELSLKYQLATFGPPVGVEANWNTHNLETLSQGFMTMLEEYGTEDPDEADEVIVAIIGEFAKIDPGSFSMRYPADRKGAALPVTHSRLHLPSLKETMEKVANFFDGCDGYLSNRSAQ